MTLNLTISQHEMIHNMILSKFFAIAQIIEFASCNKRFVRAIRSNLHCFNITKTFSNDVEQPRSITLLMFEALFKHLLEKPKLY